MIYLALAILYLLILDRPTFQLLKLPLVQHLFGAALCLLMVLWQLKGQLPDSPPVHFLGVTTLVIVLGLRLSLLLVPLALLIPPPVLALVNNTQISIDELQLWQWLAVVVAVIQSYLVLLASQKWLPRQLFVVIFVGGFFNSILSSVTYLLLQALGYSWLGTAPNLTSDYLLITPLLAFPEGLLNGMALTMLLVYRPEWLKHSLWNELPRP
ncbi:MAG: hypothetical protein J0M22_08170 [Gammaproteobacteria bacterium]|nr:hypothetical protein [Gammaproteobacteria bacterium]